MGTNLHDLRHNAILKTSIFPANVTAACTGVGVNLSMAYEQCFAILSPSTITDGSHAVKLQSSRNDNVADEFDAADPYVDIPGATFDPVTSADSKGDPKIIEFRPPEPWVRAVNTLTTSGAGSGGGFSVEIGSQKRWV